MKRYKIQFPHIGTRARGMAPQPGVRRVRAKGFRSGSVYIAVLSISMLVAVIGVGSIVAVRSQSKSIEMMNDAEEARLYALSAIETGRLWIYQDSSWRTNRSNGNWFTGQTICSGTCALDVLDSNGTLSNSDQDPLTMTGTGYKDSATQKISVTLKPNLQPYTCLNYAVSVGGTVTLTNTIAATSKGIGGNITVTASAAVVNCNVDSVTLATGGTYNGKNKALAAALTFPVTSKVFDFYTTNGTSIPVGSLPTVSGNPQLTKIVLSPSSNPYGSTNSNGIYVIDLQNKQVQIQKIRVVGTLVLLNVGAGSYIQGGVNMKPYVSSYPTLMVQGSMALNYTNGNTLIESAGDAVSYNPASTPYPYPGGTSNATFTDTYPSTITGLIYVTGAVTTTNQPSFSNLIVGGNFTGTSGTVTPAYDSSFLTTTPPGFYPNPSMLVQSGTWKRG